MMTTLFLLGILGMQTPETTPLSAGPAPRRGIGMLVAGTGLLAIGSAVAALAAAEFAAEARCRRDSECWDGLAGAIAMPFGMLGLAVGAPLLTVGAHRNRVWRAWQRERGLTLLPRIGRSGRAWTVGLALHF